MDRQAWGRGARVERPGQATPLAVRFLTRWALPVLRVFHRPSLTGTEHLPARGRYLLVANHPTSVGLGEFGSFAALWAERFGAARPLAGFAHAFAFGVWPLPWLFAQIGAIPSTYDAAERALRQEVPIVVFPGGDHEAFRPVTRAGVVDFAGRLGFLRIARKTGSPIVPMAFRGYGAPFLHRSRLLTYLFVWPWLCGIKRYGLSVLAVLGAAAILVLVPLAWPWRLLLAYAFAASPVALLPVWPATLRIVIGAPLAPEALFELSHDASEEALLRAALARVERAVQALHDGA
ncbi:MAG: phospholipid/glycerol acyltransferase [Labilithrix sp.]|nr:phospholipid/glycerol acyltransferase [Labilithrix sp.]